LPHLLALAAQVTVWATIGGRALTIFGYTSPLTTVRLEGQQVAEQVTSDAKGYFLFDGIILPLPKPNYPELCLTAFDDDFRTSFPTCLPVLPVDPFSFSIGPVILPPTISIEKSIQGLTLPNSTVNIFVPKEAFSKDLPTYQVKTNDNGFYELNLPNAPRLGKWHVYAATSFQGSPSPKSNTLVMNVQPKLISTLLLIRNFFLSFFI